MSLYHCDACGLACGRIHHCFAAGGTDTSLCDACYGYEWDAYGEEPDLVLLRARAEAAFAAVDKSAMTIHQRADLWTDLLRAERHDPQP